MSTSANNNTKLTASNLAIHTGQNHAPSQNGDTNIPKAARELGFEMPHGWQAGQTSGQRPMERYQAGRDGPFSVSVASWDQERTSG